MNTPALRKNAHFRTASLLALVGHLHPLRLGLCGKVDRGDVTVEDASEIFECARGENPAKNKADQSVSGKLGL
jgi:hypothetical protein